MITVTARIAIGNGDNGTVTEIEGNIEGNNVSSLISEVMGKQNQIVENPFILDKSILDEGDTYADILPYYMGSVLANENGVFPSPYIITVQGEDLKHIIIEFDEQNNKFPNSIIVDGKTFVDDDAQFEIGFETDSDTHTIQIPNWNTPNEPLIITGIYADLAIEVNYSNLLSESETIANVTNQEEPNYGIISNSGNLSIVDYSGEILDFITQRILDGSAHISIYINNDLAEGVKKKEQVKLSKIENLSYDSDNKVVDIQLKDDLGMWQELNVAPIYYTPTVSTSQPLSSIYEYLWEFTTSNGYDMLSLDELDETTKGILENTILQYPVLESSNLWAEWEKLCQATLSNIYVNKVGKVIFKHNV